MVLRIPKPSISTFFAIIPILYFNSCTFEFIKASSIVLPIVALSALLWCGFLLRENITNLVHRVFPMILCLLFFGMLFLFGVQNHISVFTNDISNMLYLMFFMCVFVVYSDEYYENDRKVILSIWLVDTIIASVYSAIRLINDPTLSRMLSTGSYHSTSAASAARGIVSFGVIYGLTLVLIVLFSLIINKKGKMLFNIILFALFTLVLFLAQFTIAILLVGVGVLCVFVINNKNGTVNMQTRFFVLAIVGICLVFISPFLMQIIVESEIFGYEVNARLEEIMTFFSGGSLEGTDLLVRFMQYFTSLGALVSSFGLGKMVVTSLEVGGHSQWFDGLGNYGIFYIIYLVAVISFARYVTQTMPDKGSSQLYKLIFLIYIIMSIPNTSTWAPITLSLFVIVPFLCMEMVAERKPEMELVIERKVSRI